MPSLQTLFSSIITTIIIIINCVPQTGLCMRSTEHKLQCSSIPRVHWLYSRLAQEAVVHQGTHMEMGLVCFQLYLYHKLESPAQFTSVKHSPCCEHTLDLAQSMCCSRPQACNSMCVTAAYWCCIQVIWEKKTTRGSSPRDQ